MDAQGRILLPQPLREFAFLDKRVALVGQGGKFEIWDEQRWKDKTLADLDDRNIGELAMSSALGKLKF
jgi:MraZ protein